MSVARDPSGCPLVKWSTWGSFTSSTQNWQCCCCLSIWACWVRFQLNVNGMRGHRLFVSNNDFIIIFFYMLLLISDYRLVLRFLFLHFVAEYLVLFTSVWIRSLDPRCELLFIFVLNARKYLNGFFENLLLLRFQNDLPLAVLLVRALKIFNDVKLITRTVQVQPRIKFVVHFL